MANPFFRDNVYDETRIIEDSFMTVKGAIQKTIFLLGLAFLSAFLTFNMFLSGATDKAFVLGTVGAIVAFIAVIATSFNVQNSKPLSIIYALGEGLTLGGFSAMYNSFYNGIIIQAVVATMITLGVMLALYLTNIIKATPTFIKVTTTATLAIGIFYLLVWIASLTGLQALAPFASAYDNIFVIGLIVVVAALNLIIDFNFIEQGANNNAPSFMEWYGAMGLMITLVWLYIEFLRLIARANRR